MNEKKLFLRLFYDNHIAAKELFWATASVFERLCKETNFKRLVKRKKSSKSVYARYPFS